LNQALDQARWLIVMGLMMIGLAGLFYSYRFIGFGDYTFQVFLMFGLAIVFFGMAGWFYFKSRKDKIGKS